MDSWFHVISLATRGLRNYFAKRPFCISFEITHSCNARCKHCHLGGAVEEQRASPETFGRLARELRPVIAQLSGGEPMLRKDLEEIVRAIHVPGKAPYIVITTNATLLNEKKYGNLREAGIDEFSISLDYPDSRHDEFRGIPGLFNRIKNLIENLPLQERKGITLCCVIQNDNFRDLIKMAELAREWKVGINFSSYTCLRTNDRNYLISKDNIEEFKRIVENLIAFRKKYKTIFTSTYAFKKMIEYFENERMEGCKTGERFFNVNPDGTLSPCGLIITNFKSQKELYENFSKKNECVYCYTSIRVNSEKPVRYLILDNLKFI